MTEVETAWVAGLLEGEGNFALNHGRGFPRIRIEMTDRDVLVKLKRVLGGRGGAVREVKRQRGHKTSYCYQVAAQDEVREVLTAIMPHLGSRRATAARQMLDDCG